MASPPPRRVANRRKTLAGVSIVRTVNYSIRRSSNRVKAKKKSMPVAVSAERFVCRGLGIIQNGEEVTELAMQELSRRFEGQVPDHVLAAMRELFQVCSQEEEEEIDAALLSHGGAAGLELGDEREAAVDDV
jgi:hypothetical protein